jgi:hypothetical protein
MHRLAWRSRFSKDRFQPPFRLPRRRARKQLVRNGINGTVKRLIGGTRRLSRTARESDRGRVWVSGHEFNERIGSCCKARDTTNSMFHLRRRRGRTSTVEELERCSGRFVVLSKSFWAPSAHNRPSLPLQVFPIRLIPLCTARAGYLIHVRSRSGLLSLTR